MDFTQLGIDISSFSPDKLKILDNFLTAFKKLDAYEGKIFKPVLGGGLVEFNTAVSATNKLLDELNTKIQTLNRVNLAPKATSAVKEVRDIGNEVDNTAKKISKFSLDANSQLGQLGIQFTHIFGYLRQLAFILPGIGLAGIFNLAGEAVVKLIDYLVNAGGEFESLNKQQAEFVKELTEINRLLKENTELNFGLSAVQGVQFKKDDLNYYKSLGENLGFIIDKKIELNELDKNQSQKAINAVTGETESKAIEKQTYLVGKLSAELEKLNNQKIGLDRGTLKIGTEGTEKGLILPRRQGETTTTLKEDREAFDKLLENTQKYYDQQLGLLNHFNQATAELNQARADKLKFDSDQARKLIVETGKDNLSVVIDNNRKILDNDTSTQEERLKAIRIIAQEEKRLADLNRINITGTKDNPNLGATPDDIKIARNKEYDDELKAETKSKQEQYKVNVEYYQRLIKATAESEKDQIESEAIAQEKIFKDDNKALDKRLKAYSDYLVNKLKLQQIEENVALQKGADKPGGLTALTPEEETKIRADSTKEQLNIQANAERESYNIVYSSLQKQLKAIQDEGKEEELYRNENFIIELNGLNERYARHEISAEKYAKLRKKLEQKNRLEIDQINIEEDEKEIKRLTDFENEKLDIEIKAAQIELDAANASGDKTRIAKAQGVLDGLLAGQVEFNKAIKIARDKEQADRLKQAEDGGALEAKTNNKWALEIIKIEQELYKTIKELVDASYQYRIDRVEAQKNLIDEQYGYEIDAIDKSSLTAKDKAALDIQLQEQKREYDLKAQAEEKQLKIKQAEFDKQLAVAHIAFGTAEAIIAGVPPSPKATAAAIIGGIELIAAESVRIPTYKYGTPPGGHPGGLARYGEDGSEMVTEPYKSPYLVTKEIVSFLPKGTEVVPVKDDVLGTPYVSDGWEQTRWLGNQIRKSKQEIKNTFRPTININLGFENYKHTQLYGK